MSTIEERLGALELKAQAWDQIVPVLSQMSQAIQSGDDEIWLCVQATTAALIASPPNPAHELEVVLAQMIASRNRSSPKLQGMLDAIRGDAGQQVVTRALRLVYSNDNTKQS